jgi:hypothetical protein
MAYARSPGRRQAAKITLVIIVMILARVPVNTLFIHSSTTERILRDRLVFNQTLV